MTSHSEFAKAEKPKLTSYHFRISGFWRPKGGENTKFELWHIELPIREIVLTVGSRESPQPLISLKGDFGISEIWVSGFRESRSRVA
jgi:hypothetical protein